jgi:hypothetical protein
MIDITMVRTFMQAYSFACAADHQSKALAHINAYRADVASDCVEALHDASEASYHDPAQATRATEHSAACYSISPSTALPLSGSTSTAFF